MGLGSISVLSHYYEVQVFCKEVGGIRSRIYGIIDDRGINFQNVHSIGLCSYDIL